MDETAPQETPAGFTALLEATLTAPFTAPALFPRLAEVPAPGFGPLAANVAVYYTLAFGVNLLRAGLDGSGGLGGAALAGASVLGVALALALSFCFAGLVQGLCVMAGGSGEFRRSYQLVSLLSAMPVIMSLLNWTPMLWALPVPWTAYLAAEGCRGLHKAPAPRAWAVFGFLGAVVLCGQWAARREFARFLDQTMPMGRSTEQLQRDLQALQQALPLLPGATEALSAGPALAQPARLPSSLDLLSGPSNGPAIEEEAAPPPPITAQQAKVFQDQSAQMMAAMLPMLDNPAVTKMLDAEQKKQLGALKTLIGNAQARRKGGRVPTAEELAEERKEAEQAQLMMKKMMERR